MLCFGGGAVNGYGIFQKFLFWEFLQYFNGTTLLAVYLTVGWNKRIPLIFADNFRTNLIIVFTINLCLKALRIWITVLRQVFEILKVPNTVRCPTSNGKQLLNICISFIYEHMGGIRFVTRSVWWILHFHGVLVFCGSLGSKPAH